MTNKLTKLTCNYPFAHIEHLSIHLDNLTLTSKSHSIQRPITKYKLQIHRDRFERFLSPHSVLDIRSQFPFRKMRRATQHFAAVRPGGMRWYSAWLTPSHPQFEFAPSHSISPFSFPFPLSPPTHKPFVPLQRKVLNLIGLGSIIPPTFLAKTNSLGSSVLATSTNGWTFFFSFPSSFCCF